MAVAALLVEVAGISNSLDEYQQESIKEMLSRHFRLSSVGASALLVEAVHAVRRSTQMIGFTDSVVRCLAPEDRSQIVELLWRVACAGGRPDAMQDALVRRIAALIGVADADRVQARRNALRHFSQSKSA